MKSLLNPLKHVYGGITESRNWLFDRGQLKANKLECPVVSVGNITAGGTGKTPLVLSLLSYAVQQQLRAGIVSRGYRGQFKGIEKVDPTRLDAAEYYGDEPTLLASKFLSVPVYVGAKRFEVAQKLIREHKIDFVIADDAFQHRHLARDIDIVVVDALEAKENYEMLPAGRLREPLHNLKRAKYVVISRSNLATASELESTRNMLTGNGIKKEHIIEATTEIKALKRLCGGGVGSDTTPAPPTVPDPSPGSKVFLFSGIGNPDSFERLIAKNYQVCGAKVFRDHHTFTSEDLKNVWSAARAVKADFIFTTEKDAIKLKSLLRPDDCAIFSVEIDSRFSNVIEKLWNEIIQLAR